MRNISTGIDVGSLTTRVVVGEFLKGERNPKIIGVGEYPTGGMRHGYITQFDDTVKSIRQAVGLAEKTSGVKIKRAFVSVGDVTLRGYVSSGVAIISKADGEGTPQHLNSIPLVRKKGKLDDFSGILDQIF